MRAGRCGKRIWSAEDSCTVIVRALCRARTAAGMHNFCTIYKLLSPPSIGCPGQCYIRPPLDVCSQQYGGIDFAVYEQFVCTCFS